MRWSTTALVNGKAWDGEAGRGNAWTRPLTHEEIEEARRGGLRPWLTPSKAMPASWMDRLGKRVLILGGGGGQQGPLLAALGHEVTVIDASIRQCMADREVAEREDLHLESIHGDMAMLSGFKDSSFDTVMAPQSLNFTSQLGHIFSETTRILRDGGRLFYGVANPLMYLFDVEALSCGRMRIRHTMPFDADKSLSQKQRDRLAARGGTLEYSHSLESLIGALCRQGFVIEDLYADESGFEPVDSFIGECYLALMARKLSKN